MNTYRYVMRTNQVVDVDGLAWVGLWEADGEMLREFVSPDQEQVVRIWRRAVDNPKAVAQNLGIPWERVAVVDVGGVFREARRGNDRWESWSVRGDWGEVCPPMRLVDNRAPVVPDSRNTELIERVRQHVERLTGRKAAA